MQKFLLQRFKIIRIKLIILKILFLNRKPFLQKFFLLLMHFIHLKQQRSLPTITLRIILKLTLLHFTLLFQPPLLRNDRLDFQGTDLHQLTINSSPQVLQVCLFPGVQGRVGGGYWEEELHVEVVAASTVYYFVIWHWA